MNNQPLYIFDLDGTLADIEHRRHLVEGTKKPKFNAAVFLLKIKELRQNFGYPWHIDFDEDFRVGIETILVEADMASKAARDGEPGQKFTPDWNAFYSACINDVPNRPVIATFNQLYSIGCELRIWSGRSDIVRGNTLMWLAVNLGIRPEVLDRMLVMRKHDDFTPDEQLKRKWLHTMLPEDRRRLVAVFDDRDKVVKMWRESGVACFQVAPGDF